MGSREIGWSQESYLLYQIKQLLSRGGGGGSSTPVVETYATYSAFPVTGTAGVFYVDSTTGVSYVWNGADYVALLQGINPNFPTVVQNGKFITSTSLQNILPVLPSAYFQLLVSAPYINKTYPDTSVTYKAFRDLILTGSQSDPTATTHTVSNYELLFITANISHTIGSGFTTITYSDLKYIMGSPISSSVGITTSLTTSRIDFPELIACLCTLIIATGASGPLVFNVPKLEYIQNINFTTPALSEIFFPECLQINNLITGNQVGNLYSFPKLKVAGTLNFNGTTSVVSILLPSIEFITGTITMPSTATSLTNFTFGSSLKWCNSNFVTTSNVLNQASVDNILISLAALDGSGSTIAYSGRTVTITGGAATPSAAGLAAKATLVARGCTVTTN